MKQFTLLVVALAMLGLPGQEQASAQTITYTESATGSGYLGSTPFTDALVTFESTALISSVHDSSGYDYVDNTTSEVTVGGVTGTFTHSTITFNYPASGTVGLEDSYIGSSGTILDVRNSSLESYDLTTSVGPVSGTAGASYGSAQPYPTNLGGFYFSSAPTADTGVFQATVSSVPEASSAGLAGLLCVALLGRMVMKRRCWFVA